MSEPRTNPAKRGREIADWLRPADPYYAYDHRVWHELTPMGVTYREATGQLECEGLLVTPPRYTPRELMAHPKVRLERFFYHAELWIVAFEMAQSLHRLLWPIAAPPSTLGGSIERGYALDLESIARRQPHQRWDIDLNALDPALEPTLTPGAKATRRAT